MIEIRPLTEREDLKSVVRLQRKIWGFEDVDLIPLRLADRHQLLGTKPLVRQIGVIRHDDVRRRFPARCFVHETRAPANVREHADPAKADRLHLRDAERLVNALPKLRVGALPDIHEFHVGRHAQPAHLLLESELVHEHHFHVPRTGVEFLNALVIGRFAIG